MNRESCSISNFYNELSQVDPTTGLSPLADIELIIAILSVAVAILAFVLGFGLLMFQ